MRKAIIACLAIGFSLAGSAVERPNESSAHKAHHNQARHFGIAADERQALAIVSDTGPNPTLIQNWRCQ
jgi:hypothetical protein